MLTGHGAPELGPEAVTLGAQDYLRKDDADQSTLERAVTHAVARQQITNELRAATRDIEQLVYSVTHDLKNPLMVARGFAEVLRERYADVLGDDGVERLDRVQRSHDRMQAMLQDLMVYAKTIHAALEVQAVDLDGLARESLLDLGASSSLQLEVGPLPDVMADPRLLRRVLDNLFGNAIKYRRPDRSARLEITAEALAGGVRATLADNGRGIPVDERPGILDMFVRGRDVRDLPGTGIGLAIVRRAVERLRGTISLADGIDGGLAVVLALLTVPTDDGGALGGHVQGAPGGAGWEPQPSGGAS